MRVLVTRPMAQALPALQALRAQGVDAQALPLIEISPPADAQALAHAWHELHTFALVMFVSANAVEHFVAARPHDARVRAGPQAPEASDRTDRLVPTDRAGPAYRPNRPSPPESAQGSQGPQGPQGPPWPPGVLAASTGPGTTAALQAAGVPKALLVEPDPKGERFDSEALWQQLAGRDWRGRRVLVVRGDGGRDWLADTLRAAGAEVTFVCAYRRGVPSLNEPQRATLERALAEPARHLWWFSSSEAIAHLQTLAPAADWHAAQALATHPRIAEAALAAGFGRVATVAPGVEAVVAWLRRHAQPDNR